MKLLISRLTPLWWLIVCIGCDNSDNSNAKNSFQNDSLKLFNSTFTKFELAGFKINVQAKEKDIIERWNQVLIYHSNPSDALYITLGGQKGYNPAQNFSDNCWHFDTESIEGEGSYKRILENLNRISNNDLDFKEIKDYCNDKEDNKAWVAFVMNGDKYKWDLKVNNDWVDDSLFEKVQNLCLKYNKRGKLTFFPEGQAFVIGYLTDSEYEKIKRITGLQLEWLIDNERIY